MSNPRKFYSVDPGLIPIYDRGYGMQPSKALDTAVCIALIRRGAEIGYVRTPGGHEVDFLARGRKEARNWYRYAPISQGKGRHDELRALR